MWLVFTFYFGVCLDTQNTPLVAALLGSWNGPLSHSSSSASSANTIRQRHRHAVFTPSRSNITKTMPSRSSLEDFVPVCSHKKTDILLHMGSHDISIYTKFYPLTSSMKTLIRLPEIITEQTIYWTYNKAISRVFASILCLDCVIVIMTKRNMI